MHPCIERSRDLRLVQLFVVLRGNTMNRIEFFQELYKYCTEGMLEVRRLPSKKHAFFSLEDLEVEHFCEGKENIFFGVALRDGQGGKKKHITEIPCVWSDVDFKTTSRELLIENLKDFPFKPSLFVRSGGGVHLYFVLREPAGKEDIERIENINQRIAAYIGGDPVAFDATRILRVPGTYNYKYKPKRLVEVTTVNPVTYSLEDFEILPELTEKVSEYHPDQNNHAEGSSRTMDCVFMQHCKDNAASLSEPEWYAMITQLVREPGGVDLIHQLSKGYSKYSEKETTEKILHALNDTGPVTCTRIKQLWDCKKDCGVKSPAALRYKREKKDRINIDNVYNNEKMLAEYRRYILSLKENQFKTGIVEIDRKIRGVAGGEVLTIIARAGSFKTAMLQNLLINYTQYSKNAAIFFSLEMPISSVTERYHQIVSNMVGREVEDSYASMLPRVREMEDGFLTELKRLYVVPVKISLSDIPSYVALIEHEYKIKVGLVGIDYLGLVDSKGINEYETISRVARGSKDLAKSLKLPVVILSQVSRKGGEGEIEVKLDYGRGSGAIEEGADFVLGLWQVEKDNKYDLICRILKNRKGPRGSYWMLDVDPATFHLGLHAGEYTPPTQKKPKDYFYK